MKRIILMLVATSLLAAPAMAQEEPTATPTAPTGAPDELELVVDDNVALADYSYDDGVLTLEFYADRTAVVTIATWPEETSGPSSSPYRTARVEEDTTTTVRVETTQGVSISTAESRRAGVQHHVPAPSDTIIEGPYDGRDVAIAALAGAIAVGFAVLFGAAKLKYAGGKRGEQVA